MLSGIPWLEKLLMHMTTLINKKLSLNILNHNYKEISSALESRLELLAEHILFDQNENELKVNLKFISSNEMIKLNGDFRAKDLDTNVLSFPAEKEFQKVSGELGDIAISIPFIQNESKMEAVRLRISLQQPFQKSYKMNQRWRPLGSEHLSNNLSKNQPKCLKDGGR